MPNVSHVAAIKAMDGLYLRSIAIAENIANANSATYRLKTVDFEDALKHAAAIGPEALGAFTPQIRQDGGAIAGDDIRIDLEMASASATAVRYAALTDILNRQMQIARLAIRGGQ